MLKFRDNLVISALANVESEYTLMEEQDYYDTGEIDTVRLVFNFDDLDSFVSIPKQIAVMNSKALGFYYLDTIDFNSLDNCIVEYKAGDCSLASKKVKEIYSVLVMIYSHNDASAGLSEDKIDEYIDVIKKERHND